ncbi:MAG: hypothetical protein R3B97_01700 [Dehalococcoidia bacterium]|nr:hypothetical protein [Thermoflexaceae bacterium]
MDQPTPESPGSLTFTDRAILEGIRAGRSDVEIAVELGITTGNLKTRVERLVRTASVDSRSALARWDSSTMPSPASIQDAPPEVQLTVPSTRLPTLRLAVTIGILLIGTFFAYRWMDSRTSAAPEFPAVLASTSTPLPALPAPVPRVRYEDLESLPPIELPEGLMLFTIRGCEGCVSPISIDRTYRDRLGRIHSEPVLVPGVGESILGAWAASDASALVVSLCEVPACDGPGARSRVLQSNDAGSTWIQAGVIPYSAQPVGVTSAGQAMVRVLTSSGQYGQYLTVVQAVGGGGAIPASGSSLPDVILRSALDPFVARALVASRAGAAGDIAYTWYPENPFPDSTNIVTVLGLTDSIGEPSRTFAYFGTPLRVGAWLNDHQIVASVRAELGTNGDDGSSKYLPLLIDVRAGTTTAIRSPFSDEATPGVTIDIFAAVEGDFLAVPGVPGSCMPLQSSPRDDALAQGCIAAGSIVDLLETRLVASLEWLHVRTPDRSTGWVAPGRIVLGPGSP